MVVLSKLHKYLIMGKILGFLGIDIFWGCKAFYISVLVWHYDALKYSKTGIHNGNHRVLHVKVPTVLFKLGS